MENTETIIIVGECEGTYVNEAVTKEFSGKMLMTARPDGSVIVHNLGTGVRPICYITDADITIARNVGGYEIEAYITAEDGQQLTLDFTSIIAMHGIPEGTKKDDSVAMNILKCVFDTNKKYGPITIAKILTGTASEKVLTIDCPRIGNYGVQDSSMKVILTLIDWLIEENYLAYTEDSKPTLAITNKGLYILAGSDELPVEKPYRPAGQRSREESIIANEGA